MGDVVRRLDRVGVSPGAGRARGARARLSATADPAAQAAAGRRGDDSA
jgi:hypothetical protein